MRSLGNVLLTGRHPLSQGLEDGRHRAPWTLERVKLDALAGIRQGPDPSSRRGMAQHRVEPARLLTVAELLAADDVVDALWAAGFPPVRGPWAG